MYIFNNFLMKKNIHNNIFNKNIIYTNGSTYIHNKYNNNNNYNNISFNILENDIFSNNI